MEESGAEQFGKIDELKSHECELLDENRRLEHEPIGLRVEKEGHEAGDVESTKAVTDAKV